MHRRVEEAKQEKKATALHSALRESRGSRLLYGPGIRKGAGFAISCDVCFRRVYFFSKEFGAICRTSGEIYRLLRNGGFLLQKGAALMLRLRLQT